MKNGISCFLFFCLIFLFVPLQETHAALILNSEISVGALENNLQFTNDAAGFVYFENTASDPSGSSGGIFSRHAATSGGTLATM